MKTIFCMCAFLLNAASVIEAKDISKDQCDRIKSAFQTLAEFNLNTQKARLHFIKQYVVTSGNIFGIDERAFQEFTAFNKKVSSVFDEAEVDNDAVMRGALALREVCKE